MAGVLFWRKNKVRNGNVDKRDNKTKRKRVHSRNRTGEWQPCPLHLQLQHRLLITFLQQHVSTSSTHKSKNKGLLLFLLPNILHQSHSCIVLLQRPLSCVSLAMEQAGQFVTSVMAKRPTSKPKTINVPTSMSFLQSRKQSIIPLFCNTIHIY